jgi:sigma54-dependent transcription regulator
MQSDTGSIKDNVIEFSAQVSKVTTMADGGLRVVLDMSETEIEVAKKMMQVKQAGAILKIAAVPIIESGWINVPPV